MQNGCINNEIQVDAMERLIQENGELRNRLERKNSYIRNKINQLLEIMGTKSLDPAELDDETLIDLDPLGIVCDSFRHILTHLQDTNSKLQVALDETEAIFASAGVGILVIDKDRHIRSFNSKLKELFMAEISEGDIVGHSCFDLLCEGNPPLEGCSFEQIVKGNSNARLKNWGVRGRVLDVSGIPIRDQSGVIDSVVLVYNDITELKETEKNLIAEKERLAVTMRSIGDGVITTDINSRVTLINRVAEQLTGWSQEMATGQPLEKVFNIVAHNSGIRSENPADRVFKSGSVVTPAENTTLIALDGTERIIADSAAPICDSKSCIVGAVLVFRDVTRQKELEIESHRAQKLDSLGILAGGIAHDFNNLLTGIVGNISMARMGAENNSKIMGKLIEAEKASFRARDLAKQLLTFAKGGAPVKSVAQINELLSETSTFVLSGSNVLNSINIQEELWNADVDKGQISQVIHNLLINAVQEMPNGGKVFICAENRSVGTGDGLHLANGDYLHISIRDTGKGIPHEIFPFIFDPYFTTKKTGSGLGLATSYSIVKNHGGVLTAESKNGEGATVHIYLPASLDEASPDNINCVALMPGKGHILVMDDELFIRDVLAESLDFLGYTALTAENGEEAIALYRESLESAKPFDAVVLDLTIPGGMGGKETIAELLKIDPGVKAIVSSGYSNDPVISEYKRFGFKGAVLKPYVIEELGKTLNSVIYTSDHPNNIQL